MEVEIQPMFCLSANILVLAVKIKRKGTFSQIRRKGSVGLQQPMMGQGGEKGLEEMWMDMFWR